MNNKELVKSGHELAKAISNDTPLIEIAKMVSNLATQLDVQIARSSALAAELSAVLTDRAVILEDFDNTCFEIGMQRGEMSEAYPTPMVANHDAFLAEMRAQGVEMFAAYCGEENSVFVEAKAYYRSLPDAAYEFAAEIRKGVES
ncbi:hypothetical protein ACVM2Z_000682 [Citrobacter freundii]